MSNVTLQIGGRDYTVACAEGEEAHVGMLGRLIDRKLSAMGNGSQNEVRTLLFATLLLADELYEARKQAGNGEDAGDTAPAVSEDVASALEALAVRVENLAIHLESQGNNA